MKFLHAADVHLDSPLRGLRRKGDAPVERIREASRRALENLVTLATTEAVDFVVVAGDLFDGDRDNYGTSHFFVEQAVRLKKAGIPLLLIWGNHDAQSKMSRTLQWPDNVKVFSAERAETLTAEALGVDAPLAVHGWSFYSPSEQRNLAAVYPRAISGCFNLGILHTSLTGVEGHDTYAPCTLDDLAARGYDYWALGHIHQRDWLPARKLEPGAAPVVFPGNLQGRHIKESGAKGCYLIEADATGVKSQVFRPLDVFRWEAFTVDVSECAAVDDAYAECGRRLEAAHRAAEGRPIGIRVTCAGDGGVFDRLASRPAKTEAELTRILLESYDDEIWLEGLRFERRAAETQEEALSDAIAEYLQKEVAVLASEREGSEYAALFDDLLRKLPPELADEFDLREGELTSAAWWKETVREAETLLWARLREKGASEEGAAR